MIFCLCLVGACFLLNNPLKGHLERFLGGDSPISIELKITQDIAWEITRTEAISRVVSRVSIELGPCTPKRPRFVNRAPVPKPWHSGCSVFQNAPVCELGHYCKPGHSEKQYSQNAMVCSFILDKMPSSRQEQNRQNRGILRKIPLMSTRIGQFVRGVLHPFWRTTTHVLGVVGVFMVMAYGFGRKNF